MFPDKKKNILTVLSIALLKTFETKLIVQCPLPWKAYYQVGSFKGGREVEECHNKCAGRAFYNDEGELVCFKERELASRIPAKYIKDPAYNKCYCGYRIRRHIGRNVKTAKNTKSESERYAKWEGCQPIERTHFAHYSSRSTCKVECSGVAVYLYVRNRIKYLVHCEAARKRWDFFNVAGENGDLRIGEENNNETNTSKNYNKHRYCACGIENEKLVPTFTTQEPSSVENFKECDNPWPISKIPTAKLDTCSNQCFRRCNKAKGINRAKAPLCFHRVEKTRMKYREDSCICGHGKRYFDEHGSLRTKFVDCEPRIEANNTSYRECVAYCGNARVYITWLSKRNSIYFCQRKPDFIAQNLNGKCDERALANGGNSQYRYMICRCGLNLSEDGGKGYYVDVSRDVPPSWIVKKKRSNKRSTHRRDDKMLRNDTNEKTNYK